MGQTKAIFPLCYFGSIAYWAGVVRYDEVLIEKKEFFVKQSVRNRTSIVGAGGVLDLSVPTTRKGRDKSIVDEVPVVYDEDWQVNHWRSICTAYRSSPYFEYYEADFEPIFLKHYDSLFELNLEIFKLLVEKLQLIIKFSFTEEFNRSYEFHDYRPYFERKAKDLYQYPRYIQVFEERTGFVANASILDLLFNEGPSSVSYLKSVVQLERP